MVVSLVVALLRLRTGSGLTCPIKTFDDDVFYNNDNIPPSQSSQGGGQQHRYADYSRGELSRSVLATMRGESPAFYRDVLDKAVMAWCDVETASERCVPANSSLAVKDWQDQCVVLLDNNDDDTTSCAAGGTTTTCERHSNCYWDKLPSDLSVPRSTRFKPVTRYETAADELWDWQHEDSYVRGVCFYGAVGAVVTLVLTLAWAVFFVGRYLCCCLWTSCENNNNDNNNACFLCSPIPKKRGYQVCAELLLPLLCYLLCTVGIAAAAGLAFVGNEDINKAASDTFLHSSNLAQDLGDFLARSKQPLVRIDAIVQDAALDAKSIFTNTDYVVTTADHILASFVDFSNLHARGLDQSNTVTNLDQAFDGFNQQVRPIVQEVQTMLDTLQVDVYDKADLIQHSIVAAMDDLDSFSHVTQNYQERIHDVEGQEFAARPYRQAAVLVLFLLSFFCAAVGLLAVLFERLSGKSGVLFLLNVAGVCCALLGCAALLLASVALSLNTLWYDTCEMSNIVVQDFEPFVGDKVALGANACFDNTNLAVAFNVSDKVDFQAKLDESLAILSNTNITEKFTAVTTPLQDIQTMVETITGTALSLFNQGTAVQSNTCPFNDTYTKETILTPWTLHNPLDATDWVINSTGTFGSYERLDLEAALDYMVRLYTKAGVCDGSSLSSSLSCCLTMVDGSDGTTNCSLTRGQPCNGGSDCVRPCDPVTNFIVQGYAAYLSAWETETGMSSDLGVVCPAGAVSCPTEEFALLSRPRHHHNNNETLFGLLSEYRHNISGTTDELVDLASTSVGDTMDEVQDFLCNMNVSFVAQRYDEVRYDLCESMFGGVAQIHWALWLLALSLQGTAVLAHILSVRLRGLTVREAKLEREYGDSY